MKIGVIGDAHFRDALGYADYITDRREGERKQILDFIVDSLKDCDNVVFMGDNFDKPNPPSHVVRAFTEFVERFKGKEVFIIAGNHEKTANGRTAIDYLKEIKNPNWHIITTEIVKVGEMVFCPYFYRQELGVTTYEEATKSILTSLEGMMLKSDAPAKYLFVHHAISDSVTPTGKDTSLFPEIVLPRQKLQDIFLLSIGGHIHQPQVKDRVVVTGSVFNNEAGDKEKAIWTIENDAVKRIPLPGRGIHTLSINGWTANTIVKLENISKNSIVKVVVTNPTLPLEEIKKFFSQFDAHVLLEQYPDEREKINLDEGAMMEFNIENLLSLYADAKKVDIQKLLNAWEMIK